VGVLHGMSPRQERKKARERTYLDAFQHINGWSHAIDPRERESPDFILRAPDGAIGVEITELCKHAMGEAERNSSGSPNRIRESLRRKCLQRLEAEYDRQGGKPIDVQANLSFCTLTDTEISAIASRLIDEWPTGSLRKRVEIVLCSDQIATFYALSLPDGFAERRRWTCVNNFVGWVRPASDQVLAETIRTKASKLAEYRKAARKTILLIVADRTQESGMFEHREAPLLASHGFSEVHLLIHPLESHRIA